MFSVFGPALGIASAAVIDLIAGRPFEIGDGTVLAFMFSLGVSIVIGPLDGYFAHFFSQPLRASLSAVVGAATAAFLVIGLTKQAIAPQSLLNVAVSGAVCMGLCSLLSAIPC
ncbi:hypothetical protein [Bradyrhizobium sp.]|uniref:hypothetical protein n=1 Tax=Bradyrhizobium sp. TaxID=376 RepID=UPI00261E4140|nr:hypothetical protein [Bradyrhizobium sp.]